MSRVPWIAAVLLAPGLCPGEEDSFNRIEAVAVYGASAEKAAEPGAKPLLSRDRVQIVTRRQAALEADPELRHLSQIYTGPELGRRRADAWRAAVERLVDLSLVLQAGRQAEVKIQEAEVRAQIRRHMTRLGVDYERHLSEILEAQGGSLEELRESYRSQLTVQRYLDQVLKPPPPPSPGEVLRFYADHIAEFSSPQEVQLRQIVLRKSRFPERSDAEAKLRELWSALQGGMDFSELARKISDSPSAEQGGLFPYLPASSLRGDLQDLVRDVASGRTLAVQETEDAYVIVRVEGVRQGDPKPPSEAQSEILDRMRRSDMESRRSRILQLLRSKAYVWTAGAP